VPGNPLSANYSLAPIAVHPSGKFVFAGRAMNQPGDGVDAYQVNSDGSLTLVPGSPFSPQPDPASLAVDPLGKYLYVGASSTIETFAIDETSGALTPLPSPIIDTGSCNASPSATIDPFGSFVYTADGGANEISAFAIDPSAGTLTEAAGSPYPDYGGCTSDPYDKGNPNGIAIEATGRFLYAAD
jgi:6-phosphogluconolactonase